MSHLPPSPPRRRRRSTPEFCAIQAAALAAKNFGQRLQLSRTLAEIQAAGAFGALQPATITPIVNRCRHFGLAASA